MFVEFEAAVDVAAADDDDDVLVASLSVDVVVGEGLPYWALTRTGRNRAAANARENFMVAVESRRRRVGLTCLTF
jgi:hypothetical protein